MTPTVKITAAMLYDLVQCPHRLSMDLFGDPTKRDEVNAFVQLLWEKGTAYEQEFISGLNTDFIDLSQFSGADKEHLTIEAMKRGDELIYGGRISAGDLVGAPDLLRKENGKYVAGDIKSGGGEDGHDDNAKPKKHYGVQVALYTDILIQLGFANARTPFIWDVSGDEVIYDLDEPQGIRNPWTLWDVYEDVLLHARQVAAKCETTLPAYGGNCKLCHWYTACKITLEASDDLTLIPELGRTKRDTMVGLIPTIYELSAMNVDDFIVGKKTVFSGIGPSSLEKFHSRAKLCKTRGAKPYLTQPIRLPRAETELFFDIEVDPMRGFCYLHGFVERRHGDNSTEKFCAFFADSVSPIDEERAFAEAWAYIEKSQPCTVYYYSKYERTIWRQLQTRYPSVCSADEIEDLFDPTNSVDLYFDVVKKATEWPTNDYSIKSLAKFLGFRWRDTHPSGAASIEWFDRLIKTGDQQIKKRILDYNEDDCIATRVLLDGIRKLSIGGAAHQDQQFAESTAPQSLKMSG
jgi:predicted RecB family nuclease